MAQALFTGYLRDFGGFDSAYGPIAGLAAVLTWALVASGIILLAAHSNPSSPATDSRYRSDADSR